ncbi:hypothetical protein [cf. Phormidesmis sp. LEGE 11477]|uniref:hypothetical protein n=1 Tax=cf. Phormidesmis sp. LEGE 11477 TaxID=1828680 RepID=UPI00187DDFE3|nr:hypothetical protein [cf. Phormidesmis sp. LEGE 11477]MBE9060611.1 hypothetical protein [cf. Phormidesmis sp. LEGE 11477]
MTNSPFHDPRQNPLPDANDIEQEAVGDAGLDSLQEGSPRSPSPHIKRDIQRLRNLMIGLLLAGLTLGFVVAIGVIFFMKRTGLADPPNPTNPPTNQGQINEQIHTGVHKRTPDE